jgi:hypothetical protein
MCTANSCRSILSEAVFNHLAPQGFQAVSAGSFPKGQVLPRSLATLQQAGIAIAGLSSKGNDAFADNPPDIVITVCDKAAGEACPVYFGPALKAHWGLEDPPRWWVTRRRSMPPSRPPWLISSGDAWRSSRCRSPRWNPRRSSASCSVLVVFEPLLLGRGPRRMIAGRKRRQGNRHAPQQSLCSGAVIPPYPRLLLFRHPLAGVQLVKGSIEKGEAPVRQPCVSCGRNPGSAVR